MTFSARCVGYTWSLSTAISYIHVHNHYFQTSSSLKLLGQSNQNFIWSLLGKGGGAKVYINGLGHMTKMAAMPIYGENLKKSSPLSHFSNTFDASETANCSIKGLVI